MTTLSRTSRGADHRFLWSVCEGLRPANFHEIVGRAILPAAGFQPASRLIGGCGKDWPPPFFDPGAFSSHLAARQTKSSPQHPAPSTQHPRPKAAPESGYALLLVFLMAAIIALALYAELPRVAFEAQRAKEQLLIERGEQYKRAIQVFVRKINRYPSTIEELENTNNFRFLRKRYIDPMTGNDKWRLIHVNGGMLTDSIIPQGKPGQGQGQDQQQPPANTNTFIAEGPVMGATNDPNQQQINPAMRRRASDDQPVVPQEAPPTPPDAGDENSVSDDNNNSAETPAPGTPGATATPGMPNQQTPGVSPGR